MTTGMTASELRELVKAAFDAARQSGRPDWARMTSAVLKNRLLQLTGGEFTEKSFGARSFSELLTSLDDVVSVDRTSFPPIISLVGAPTEAPTTPAIAPWYSAGRIRPDLWLAVMDYSSGRSYVWDPEQGRARVGTAREQPRIPTVSRAELDTWRSEFVAGHLAGSSEEEADLIAVWQREGLPTQNLPPRLRLAWNHFLKQRALDRIQQWLTEQGISAPDDLLVRGERQDQQMAELAALRRTVVELIGEMTLVELRSLPIPAGVLVRRRGSRPRRA